MAFLYHITDRENVESIQSEGLTATNYLALFEELGLSASLESLSQYVGSEMENTAKRAFAEYLFEEQRPAAFPSRGKATYYYAHPIRAAFEAKISPNDIEVIRIETDQATKSFVAGTEVWSAYPIVRTLKSTENATPEINTTHLRDQISFYWSEAQSWKNEEHPQWEVYYPDSLPSSCIDTVVSSDELWNRSEN